MKQQLRHSIDLLVEVKEMVSDVGDDDDGDDGGVSFWIGCLVR